MTVLRLPTGLDDAQLLADVAGGDEHAFRAIYDRHHGAAYSVARRFLRPPAAEDVAHEALVALWRTAGRHAPARGTVRALVTVMARSRALDRLRRDGARHAALDRAMDSHDAGFEPPADVHVLRQEEADELHEALERLPTDQETVVRMVYLAGRTHAEAADELGIPVGTAKGRTRLALAKLRVDLAHLAPAA